jgi:hypothetical protein
MLVVYICLIWILKFISKPQLKFYHNESYPRGNIRSHNSKKYRQHNRLWLSFFHLLARKSNLDKFSIYSNKFFHNFHSSESSFTCPGLQARSGLAWRLFNGQKKKVKMTNNGLQNNTQKAKDWTTQTSTKTGMTGKVINSYSTSGWHIKRVYNATLYMLESTASWNVKRD